MTANKIPVTDTVFRGKIKRIDASDLDKIVGGGGVSTMGYKDIHGPDNQNRWNSYNGG